jgi:hypothetical protein
MDDCKGAQKRKLSFTSETPEERKARVKRWEEHYKEKETEKNEENTSKGTEEGHSKGADREKDRGMSTISRIARQCTATDQFQSILNLENPPQTTRKHPRVYMKVQAAADEVVIADPDILAVFPSKELRSSYHRTQHRHQQQYMVTCQSRKICWISHCFLLRKMSWNLSGFLSQH